MKFISRASLLLAIALVGFTNTVPAYSTAPNLILLFKIKITCVKPFDQPCYEIAGIKVVPGTLEKIEVTAELGVEREPDCPPESIVADRGHIWIPQQKQGWTNVTLCSSEDELEVTIWETPDSKEFRNYEEWKAAAEQTSE